MVTSRLLMDEVREGEELSPQQLEKCMRSHLSRSIIMPIDVKRV